MNCAEEGVVTGNGIAGEEKKVGPGAVGDGGAGVANFPNGLEGLIRGDSGREDDGVDDEVSGGLEDGAAAILVFELSAGGVAERGEIHGGFVDGDASVADGSELGGGNFAGGAEREIDVIEAGDVGDEDAAAIGSFETGSARGGVGKNAGEAGKIDGGTGAIGDRFESAIDLIERGKIDGCAGVSEEFELVKVGDGNSGEIGETDRGASVARGDVNVAAVGASDLSDAGERDLRGVGGVDIAAIKIDQAGQAEGHVGDFEVGIFEGGELRGADEAVVEEAEVDGFECRDVGDENGAAVARFNIGSAGAGVGEAAVETGKADGAAFAVGNDCDCAARNAYSLKWT